MRVSQRGKERGRCSEDPEVVSMDARRTGLELRTEECLVGLCKSAVTAKASLGDGQPAS